MVFRTFPLWMLLVQTSGHGNMKIPYTWHDSAMVGVTEKNTGCVHVELSDSPTGWPNMDGRTTCINAWYSNSTTIPGEATISNSMLTHPHAKRRKNPWFAPGTAPVYHPVYFWP